MKELPLHNNGVGGSDFVKWERRTPSRFTLYSVRKIFLWVARLWTPLREFFELPNEPWRNRKGFIATFHRATPHLLECCGNVYNVVKCCENPKMLWNSLSGLAQIIKIGWFLPVRDFTTFSGRSEKTVYTLFRKSPYVLLFEGWSWRFWRLRRKKAIRFLAGVQNVVKCCEMLWNRFSQHFTTFCFFSQHSPKFHNISQHLRESRRPQLSNASGHASKVPIAAENRPEPSA